MQKIKNVFISQPAPLDYDKSPYKALTTKYGLKIVFRKAIKIEGVSVQEFRGQRINILDHTAVIFTSRNAVDHFFRILTELRLNVPASMKYFCSSETTAFYIQNYIQYRKRKVFYGRQTLADLVEVMAKHKDEVFFLPSSEETSSDLPAMLDKLKVSYTKVALYRTVPDDIKEEIDIEKFDLLAFFSPIGIRSLSKNFPNFVQKEKLIAAFGQSVWTAVEEAGFRLDVAAPTPTASSMAHAIDEYLIDYYKSGGVVDKKELAEKKAASLITSTASKRMSPKIRGTRKSITVRKKTPKSTVINIKTNAAANKEAALAVMARKKKVKAS